MTLPRNRRLSLEAFKDAPGEVVPVLEQLFEVLNPFLSSVSDSLDGGLTWESLNGLVNTISFTAPDRWIAATLTNSWAGVSGTATPGYWKDDSGRVWLRGAIDTGSLGTSAFTLPAAYRPAATTELSSYSDDGALVTIATSGTVTPTSGGAPSSVNLDGLSFEASDATPVLPGSPFPVIVNCRSIGLPRYATVLRCEDVTSSQRTAARFPTLTWEATSINGIPMARITNLSGLTPGRKYQVSVLVMA